MAVIAPTITEIGNGDGSTFRIVWTPLTENDTCAPVAMSGYADKSVHVFGTFGSGTVALQGSNDGGANYAALNDPGGTAIGIATAAKIKGVLENTEWIKPVASGGTGQSLSIAVVARLANPMRT
jgi:hypothetical protein